MEEEREFQKRSIAYTTFSDEIVLLAGSRKKLVKMLEDLYRSGEDTVIKIN